MLSEVFIVFSVPQVVQHFNENRVIVLNNRRANLIYEYLLGYPLLLYQHSTANRIRFAGTANIPTDSRQFVVAR